MRTENFNTDIKTTVKITFGNTALYTVPYYVNYYAKCVDGNSIGIGGTPSARVEMEIDKEVGLAIEGNEFKLEYINNGITFLIGYFTPQKPEEEYGKVKIVAYDRMVSVLNKKFEVQETTYVPDTIVVGNLINHVCDQTGITVRYCSSDMASVVSTMIANVWDKYNIISTVSCRTIIAWCAAALGTNAWFDKNGILYFGWITNTSKTIEKNEYYEGSLSINDNPIQINSATFTTEADIYNVGNVYEDSGYKTKDYFIGTDGMDWSNELKITTPVLSIPIITYLFNRIKQVSVLSGEVKLFGDLRYELGDIVSIVSEDGSTKQLTILELNHEWDGGFITTIKSLGEKQSDSTTLGSTSFSQSINSAMSGIKDNILKLDYLDADYGTFKNLTTENFTTTNGNIANLTVNYGEFKTLVTENFTATNANIGNLTVDTAHINTVLFGSATGESLTVDFVSSVTALIQNAGIKDAMIHSLGVGKILAGDISTNKFRITSDTGKLLISDNTIQISDATRTRVQIGKDASNDYNMYVWDASGNLMFDATGIKASAIKSKIIRDDMISDSANISGTKVDIDSIITRINTDGTTSLLTSTLKIGALSFDSVFNNLTETVSLQSSAITQNATNIDLKVGKNGVLSAINLSSEDITIKSSKIKLEGYTSINGGFLVDAYGNVGITKGKLKISDTTGNVSVLIDNGRLTSSATYSGYTDRTAIDENGIYITDDLSTGLKLSKYELSLWSYSGHYFPFYLNCGQGAEELTIKVPVSIINNDLTISNGSIYASNLNNIAVVANVSGGFGEVTISISDMTSSSNPLVINGNYAANNLKVIGITPANGSIKVYYEGASTAPCQFNISYNR